MKKYIKISILNHTIQGIIVFSSVYLAFWLTKYNEEKSKNEQIKNSLENIANEVTINHEKIEKIIDYHINIKNKLDSIKSKNPLKYKTLNYKDINWNGVNLPRLNAEAYHSLVNSNLVNSLEFKQQKLLYQTYEFQLILSEIEKSIISNFNDTSKSEAEHYHNISSILVEILPMIIIQYQENGFKLLNEYGYGTSVKGFVKKYKESYNK
jgi:hypothetical protein